MLSCYQVTDISYVLRNRISGYLYTIFGQRLYFSDNGCVSIKFKPTVGLNMSLLSTDSLKPATNLVGPLYNLFHLMSLQYQLFFKKRPLEIARPQKHLLCWVNRPKRVDSVLVQISIKQNQEEADSRAYE